MVDKRMKITITPILGMMMFLISTEAMGAELLIMDKTGIVTKADHGFWWDKKPAPASANINLKSPVDYSTGTVYTRAEIRSMPKPQRVRLSMEIDQYRADGKGPYYGISNCGGSGLMDGPTDGTPAVKTWFWSIKKMFTNGLPIDWSRPRSSHQMVIWTAKGKNLSDYDIPENAGLSWGGVNPDEFFPMNVRFTSVIVTEGAVFSGWHNYVSMDISLNKPNGGETFHVGDMMTVAWHADTAKVKQVLLEYSPDMGKNWTAITKGATIRTSAPDWGSYKWVIPESPSLTGLIKIRNPDNSAQQDWSGGVFTILPKVPSLRRSGSRRAILR